MDKKEMQKDLENKATESTDDSHAKSEDTLRQSVGQYLKGRRDAKGISLKTISKETKISVSKLEFLEKDDFKNLPNKIYVEGYIKSYAKSVGIDAGDCLKILQETHQARPLRRRLSLQEIPKEHQERRKQSSYVKMGFAVSGMIFIALLVLVLNYKYRKDPSSQSEVSQPPPVKVKSVDEETSFKLTPNKIVVESTQESNEENEEEERETASVSSGSVVKEESVEKEERVIEEKEETDKEKKKRVDFFPMNRVLYSFDTSVSSEEVSEMIPAMIQEKFITGKQNVYMKASRGNSWLSYKADNKSIRNITVKEGKDLLIKGNEVRIFFANIKALDIFLNNKLLTINSSTGLKSIVFPQENRFKYVRPLFIYHESGKSETSDEYLARQKKEEGNL